MQIFTNDHYQIQISLSFYESTLYAASCPGISVKTVPVMVITSAAGFTGLIEKKMVAMKNFVT